MSERSRRRVVAKFVDVMMSHASVGLRETGYNYISDRHDSFRIDSELYWDDDVNPLWAEVLIVPHLII